MRRARARRAGTILVVAGLCALAGCEGLPRLAPNILPAMGTPDGHPPAVRVFFATDRAPTGATAIGGRFSGGRSRTVTYGEALVSIPADHRCGRIERPGLLEVESPARHVKLMDVKVVGNSRSDDGADAFIEALQAQVARSSRREVLVFVHGYASPFDDMLRRTAQLAHDLQFDGVPVLYSWPSEGLLLSYLVDASNSEWTVPYFARFLDLLVRRSGAEHIHVIGHSMGTRVVSRGVRDYMALRGGRGGLAGASGRRGTATDSPYPLDQVILAAADMDVDIFERDYVPSLLEAARRTTIYMSRKDKALGISLQLNGYDRLGRTDLPNVDLDDLKRIEVVDATEYDNDLVGHYYYASNPAVLADLRRVLRGEAPQERELQREFIYRMRRHQ